MTKATERDPAPITRRKVLAAASGAAAVLVTGSLWRPESVSATDPNDVVLGGDNNATTSTRIFQSTANIAGLYVTSEGTGPAIEGLTPDGVAVHGHSSNGIGTKGQSTTIAGVWGENGDGTQGTVTPADTTYVGVFGFAPAAPDGSGFVGNGLWGDSPDIGVFGSGSIGVQGNGGWGVLGTAFDPGDIGVYAHAGTTAAVALNVTGKARFSRSGRAKILAGQSTRTITLAGVSTSSMVFAHLATNRSGRWVRAIVSGTGRFTIYLNTSVTSDSYLQYFVLN
jgi:hypothetical protein